MGSGAHEEGPPQGSTGSSHLPVAFPLPYVGLASNISSSISSVSLPVYGEFFLRVLVSRCGSTLRNSGAKYCGVLTASKPKGSGRAHSGCFSLSTPYLYNICLICQLLLKPMPRQEHRNDSFPRSLYCFKQSTQL